MIFLSMYIAGTDELITHDKSYEEAKEFMANVRAFTYAGWQAVIGMKF